MRQHKRGSDIDLIAEHFLNSDGDAATPSAVTFRVEYPLQNRSRGEETLTGTQDGSAWFATWSSINSFPGTVYVFCEAAGSDIVTAEDQFQLVANPANPNP